MKNKTAVQIFFEDLCHLGYIGYIEYPDESLVQDRLNLALELEKQQHEATFEAGYRDLHESFDEYYSQTYKKEDL